MHSTAVFSQSVGCRPGFGSIEALRDACGGRTGVVMISSLCQTTCLL